MEHDDDKKVDDKPRARAPKAVKTVRMKRQEHDAQGGPLTADVHPDEVEKYAATGWSEV
jgi:hypothetical protein